jgi:hypothetical protein
LVGGDGAPVMGAALTVDGTVRAPRMTGGHEFELDRSLVGHALDVDGAGFLVHQNLVPDRDRTLDLFAVPADASKDWIRNLLYDGAISRNGRLARLLRPVSIVRGTTLPLDTWVGVRATWEVAAGRLSGLTGYNFRLTDQAEPGTVAFTVEIDPQLSSGGYFEWTGAGNVIERGIIRFRTAGWLGQFSLVLHELTHGVGLSHSDRTTDVMHATAVSDNHSIRERHVIEAIKRRPANTAYEDNVRAATSSLARGRVSRSYDCGGE